MSEKVRGEESADRGIPVSLVGNPVLCREHGELAGGHDGEQVSR